MSVLQADNLGISNSKHVCKPFPGFCEVFTLGTTEERSDLDSTISQKMEIIKGTCSVCILSVNKSLISPLLVINSSFAFPYEFFICKCLTPVLHSYIPDSCSPFLCPLYICSFKFVLHAEVAQICSLKFMTVLCRGSSCSVPNKPCCLQRGLFH
jgi:hypothetical protein